MDLGTVTDLVPTADPADWREGDAWLAGGPSCSPTAARRSGACST